MIYKLSAYSLYASAGARFSRKGVGLGDNTYPDNPTQDKDDVWPLALTDLEGASWSSGYSYDFVRTIALWKWAISDGVKRAACELYIGAARFDTSDYAGQSLAKVQVDVSGYEYRDKDIMVGACSQSSDSPGSTLSWVEGTANRSVSGNGSYLLDCGWTLQDYLFVTVFVDGYEPPNDRFAYPNYYQNCGDISSSVDILVG
jgi:hypothetical protein